ncbi:MAG: hypothetical protein J6B81_01550 [Spirochaetaceae bacterium]|nr:hypothetical protein [Spirochaetaceae bacterium]
MKRFNYFIFVTLFFFLVGSLTISADPVADRFISAANDQYSIGEYAKAYEYINRVLDLSRSGTLSDNAAVLAEMIYYSYIGELRKQGDSDSLQIAKVWLKDFPVIESSRIKTLVAAFETDIEKKTQATNQIATTVVTSDTAAIEKILDAQAAKDEAAREAQKASELEARKHDTEMLQTFKSVMELSTQQNESMNKTILVTVLVIGGILVVVFVIVLIGVSISSKNAKKQQEQFAATLQMVAQMSRIPSERLMLDGVTDVYGDSHLRLVNGTVTGVNGLPEPEVDEKEMQVIREFALRCEQIGNEIDVMTGRKNNSKNISEMVYKISMELGIKKNIAMLYFCAAMVYDIGFLGLNKDLLQAEQLSEEEKYSIRSHVKPEEGCFDFIPEKYRNIFTQAAATHHENMDGSGYPGGLKGEDIPLISRMIHVVESFVSLISRRNYRAIFDKESAIQELKNHPELYDEQIVAVLDSIV